MALSNESLNKAAMTWAADKQKKFEVKALENLVNNMLKGAKLPLGWTLNDLKIEMDPSSAAYVVFLKGWSVGKISQISVKEYAAKLAQEDEQWKATHAEGGFYYASKTEMPKYAPWNPTPKPKKPARPAVNSLRDLYTTHSCGRKKKIDDIAPQPVLLHPPTPTVKYDVNNNDISTVDIAGPCKVNMYDLDGTPLEAVHEIPAPVNIGYSHVENPDFIVANQSTLDNYKKLIQAEETQYAKVTKALEYQAKVEQEMKTQEYKHLIPEDLPFEHNTSKPVKDPLIEAEYQQALAKLKHYYAELTKKKLEGK
jgi:hypothetical protein